jgi:hypothetical protein
MEGRTAFSARICLLFSSSSFSVRSMVIVILVEASRFLNCNRGFGQVVEMMKSDGAGDFSHPTVNVVGRK